MGGAVSPLVTIGLPVYNGERFVQEAIASLLGQVDVDLELIISDNGSTDGTRELCTEAASSDARVTYLRSEVNCGAAWNYNRLVEAASGAYFKWAAHDDVCAPTFVARCVEVLEEHADVALCYPRAVDIDATGAVIKEYAPFRYADEPTPGARARSVLRNPTPCFETFGLLRRAQLLRTGMIGPYTSSDRTLLFELALQGRFFEIDDVLFRHRQHGARSVHSYRGARDRGAWFAPSRGEGFTFARWRLLGEHCRALARAPVALPDRLAAGAGLPRWAVANWRRLAREVAAWAAYRARSPRTRPDRGALHGDGRAVGVER